MADVCPWCSNPLELTARKPGGKSTSTRTTAEWLGATLRDMFRSRGYKSTAPASPWGQPVVNVTQPAQPSGPLNPGEQAFRGLSKEQDIEATSELSKRAALLAGGIISSVAAWVQWPVLRVLWILSTAVSSVWLVLYLKVNWDIFTRGLTGPRFTTRQRDAEPVQADATPTPRKTLVTVQVEDGNTSRFLGDIPVTPEMKRFALRVLSGSASFSEDGAEDCGLEKDDFLKLRNELLDRDMLNWKKPHNHRSGYVWTVAAKRALAKIRDFPLPLDGA